MLSNFGIRFFITLILVEIFDPPIIHVIGLLISEVTFLKAVTSVFINLPQYEGRNFVILSTDA